MIAHGTKTSNGPIDIEIDVFFPPLSRILILLPQSNDWYQSLVHNNHNHKVLLFVMTNSIQI